MADELDVDGVDFESFHFALLEAALDKGHQFIVDDILETVVDGVVKMKMFESVDVEVHLVVRAEPAMVNAQISKRRESVVNRSHGDGRAVLAGFDMLYDHICTGVADAEHGFVNGNPLRSGLEVLVSQQNFEFVKSRS